MFRSVGRLARSSEPALSCRRAMTAARVTQTLGLLITLFIAACTCGSSEPDADPTPSATPSDVASDETVEIRTVPGERTELVIHRADELADRDLSGIVHLDLAMSPLDQLGHMGEADAESACHGLDLVRVARAAPDLESLRISGCQVAVQTGLGAFGDRLVSLELADLSLDGVTIGRIRQLEALESLTLTRVSGTEDPLRPLAALSLRSLALRELERDSALAELLELWPRSLRHVRLEGRWAGHDAMLQLPEAQGVTRLELLDTRVGNFSLNQIKPLEKLRDVTFVGHTFNDSSPLYFRDLPVERFVCDCPRLGDAGLVSLKRSENIVDLELRQTAITGEGLAYLHPLRDLERLVLESHDPGLEGYEALAEFPKLRHLELSGTLLTPRMTGLNLLSGLEVLRLDYPELDDRVAGELGGLENLRQLDLSGTNISDEGLVALENMDELRILSLHHTRVTNRGLRHLAHLRRLERLDLDHTDVVDAGVAHLAGLEELRELRLDATLVTDAAIEHLVGLQKLERLNLSETVVTSEGVAKLRDLPALDTLGLADTRVGSM